MFKITGLHLKPTYCLTEEIRSTVLADYVARDFDDLEVIHEEGRECFHLDFGGMLLTTMKPMTIRHISFWPHQFDSVLGMMKASEARDGGYIKLHGRHACFCLPKEEIALTISEFESNRQLVDSEEVRQHQAWLALTVGHGG
jgi:hypothetical protein